MTVIPIRSPEAWVLACDLMDELFPAEDPAYDRACFAACAASGDRRPRDGTLAGAGGADRTRPLGVDDWYAERRRRIDELLELEYISRRNTRAVGRAMLGKIPPREPIGKNWVTHSEAREYPRRLRELRYPRKTDP